MARRFARASVSHNWSDPVTGRRMESINRRNRVVEAAKRGECYSLIAQRRPRMSREGAD